MNNLSQIKVILVETSHPGNYGAAARALANMGISRLALVNPAEYPSAQASARAAGADSILDRAQVCSTLDEAVADCQYVFGTTARLRSIEWPEYTPEEMALRVFDLPQASTIGLVFGRERSGLTNAEMDLCESLIHIPVDEGHTSLNLASAVMVVLYELRKQLVEAPKNPKSIGQKNFSPHVSAEQLNVFFDQLDQALIDLNFYKGNAQMVMRKIRRVFHKSDPSVEDINIFQGIVSAIRKHLNKQG